MKESINSNFNFLFIVFLFSIQPAAAQLENETAVDTFNTILFKVTSSDNNNISYLFGTHHAFGKSFFDSLVNADRALASCTLLIKENLNIPGQLAEDIINQRSTLTKWNKYLSKVDLSFIQNLFARSPTNYHKMTPTEMYVFLNRHFKQQVCLNKQPEDTSLSLDDYISMKAIEQNIELHGLETTAEQIELINKDVEGMPRRSHKRRLANIIDKIRTENSNDCQETDWYSKMKMDYRLNAPCRNTLILSDRNHKWMSSIRAKIETNDCFIAVGLSHLMYECGLINQLTRLGYTVSLIEVK